MSDKPDPFRKATATREELAQRYDGAQPAVAGLPVNWTDGATGKTHLRSTLATPSAHDVQVFSSPRAEVCGNCKYFDLENGRKEIMRERFAEKLVREYEWKLHHLGAKPDEVALCGASASGGGGDLTAVTFMSKSCDQFRPKKG
jgi:hypothetical protein